MSMKLVSVSINRNHEQHPVGVYCALANGKGDSINVNVPLQPHHNLEQLTVAHLEQMALDAAKKLHP